MPTPTPTRMPMTMSPKRKLTIARPFMRCHLLCGRSRWRHPPAGSWRKCEDSMEVSRNPRRASARGRLDHHAGEAVPLGEPVGFRRAVARPGKRAVGLEELRVPVPVAGGVRIRSGDAHAPELGMVLEHPR